MIKTLIIPLIILLTIILTPRNIILPNKIYNNYFFPKLLNKYDIESISECFTVKSDKSIECYKKKQELIFQKVKQKLNTKYFSVGHARWSDGSKNFDAQTFHRDIKPHIKYHSGNYPNVYTLICFLDDGKHQQGSMTYNINAGDCMLFNSFNMHKGLNMQHVGKKNKKRRVLQFFHVFLNETEKINFYNEHSYAEHFNSDFVLKYINYFIDTRLEVEYFNLVPILLPIKLHNKKNKKYITLIDSNNFIDTINGIDYYSKF